MISQKSNRVAAIKNRFENLNDASENDFLLKNSTVCNDENRTNSPIKRQLFKQSSAPIDTTVTNSESSSTNYNLNEIKRKSCQNSKFTHEEFHEDVLQVDEEVSENSVKRRSIDDSSDSFSSDEYSEVTLQVLEKKTYNNSLKCNKIDLDRIKDDGRSSLRSLSRQTSDPGRKLQRSHAFRCDRSQKISLSPKRHSSCSGRTQNDISNIPTLKIGEKPRLSRERLKKLGHVLEERMKRDNFTSFSKKHDIDNENEHETIFLPSDEDSHSNLLHPLINTSFVHPNKNSTSFTNKHKNTNLVHPNENSSILHPAINTSLVHPIKNAITLVHPHVNTSFVNHHENSTSFLQPHVNTSFVNANENSTNLIHPHMNTSFLHRNENPTSAIHKNEHASSFINRCQSVAPVETNLSHGLNDKILSESCSLLQESVIPQHILDQYAKVIKPKKSNLKCNEKARNATEIIAKHPDPMTDSGVSSETENSMQDNETNNLSTADENLKRMTKLMKLRAQFEELADSAKDLNKTPKSTQNDKSNIEFRTKHASVPANDTTGLLIEPNLCASKDGLNSSSETIKKLAVKNPHIVLTDTLKKALKQPLPDGPPPKKPPRIFATNSTENEDNLKEMSPIQELLETNVATPSPKKTKQDSKTMLEKIEKALTKHNEFSKIISPRSRDVIEDKIEPEKSDFFPLESMKRKRKEIHYMCTEILDLPYNKDTETTQNKLADVLNMSKCFPSLNCTVATNRSSGSIGYARLSSGSCSGSNRNSLNICCSCSGDSSESLLEHSIELENRSKFSTFFNIKTSQNEAMCRKCGINMGKVDDEFRCHLGCKCEELKIKKEKSKFVANEINDAGLKLDTEWEHIYAEPFQHSETNEVGCAKKNLDGSGVKSIQKVGVSCNDDITLRAKEPLPSASENKVKDILKRWESTYVNEFSVSDGGTNIVCDNEKLGGCDKKSGEDIGYKQINVEEKIYDLPCADSERSTSPESIDIRLKSTPESSPRSGSRTIDSIRRDFEKRALSTGASRASSSSPQCSAFRSGNSSIGDIRKSLENKLGEASPPSPVTPRRRYEKRVSSESTEDKKSRRKSNRQRRYDRSQLDIDRENLNRLMNEIYETVSVACEMEQGSTSSSARSDSGSRTNKFPVDGADNSSEDSIKLSRSLTEKRKNYVRRVSSRATYLENSTVGRVRVKMRHQTSVGGINDPGYIGPGSFTTFRSWKSFKMVGSQNNLNASTESDNSDILNGSHSTSAQENLIVDEIKCIETRGKLFDVCLLVGMNHMTGQAYVKNVFPEGITPPPQIENLVFPETLTYEQQNTKNSMDGQNRTEYDLSADSTQMYSLVLTNERGERSFGYCRRVLPEGATFCLPLAYCMISRYRAPGFFYKVLQEIESNHGGSDTILSSILKQFYDSDLPEPGSSISINRHIKSPKVSVWSDLRKNTTYRNSVNLGDVLKKCRTLPNSQGTEFKWPNDDNFRKRDQAERPDFFIDEADRRKSTELVSETNYYDVENNNVNIEENLKLSLAGDDDVYPKIQKPVLEARNIKHPIEPRVDENSLSILLDTMSAGLLMEVFGTLLLEKKVVLISRHLSQLSSCMEGLQQILYPFVWQHTLISTIPSDIKRDILEAPIPILAGLLTTHSSNYSTKNREPKETNDSSEKLYESVHFDEGMLIDLSSKKGSTTPKVIFRQGDEASILPSTAYKTLKTSLNLDQNSKEKVSKGPKPTQEMEKTRNVLISEAFLRFFVDSLGDFSSYFEVKKDLENGVDNVIFEKEKFIKSGHSKSTQYFLEWFTETAMFNHFIRNMTLDKLHETVENTKLPSENLQNNENVCLDESKMVDIPYRDYYRTFEERIVNSKARSGGKSAKKSGKVGGEISGVGKSNYKNIVNKKVKLLKNKLRDLVI